MCLLIAKPLGVSLPQDWEQQCEQAYRCNQDGFGFAVHAPGMKRPKLFRSIDIFPEEFARRSRKVCTPDTEAIIHFRFGTSGGTTRELCHPFRIADGTTFAHNGVLPIQPIPGFSDTSTVASECDSLDSLIARLSTYVSANNKFAILPHSGGLEIFGEEYGEWDSGVWYSNSYWRDDARYVGLQSDSPGVEDWEFEQLRELESDLADLVWTHGYKAVSEMLRLMRPESSIRRGW